MCWIIWKLAEEEVLKDRFSFTFRNGVDLLCKFQAILLTARLRWALPGSLELYAPGFLDGGISYPRCG